MKIKSFRGQVAKLGYVFILLSLILSNSGSITGAEAMTTQEEVVQIAETNAPPQIMEGDQISVTMSINGSPQPFMLNLHATDAENDSLTWRVSLPAQSGAAITRDCHSDL